MSFLSFGKEEEHVSLLIDIGNSTVTSALAVFDGDSLPKFIYSNTSSFVINDKPDGARLTEALSTILELQLKDLMKDGLKHKYWNNKKKRVPSAIVSFSSPWFVLKTKQVSVSNEKEFIISESFLNNIISKEEEIFKQELSNNSEDLFKIVEKNIIHTKINGYALNKIIGKKTRNLDAFISMSALDNEVDETVSDIILKNVHINKEKISINTFPLISFSVIRDIFTAEGNFLIIDVTGDVSDITLVQDYIIMQNVSIPSGRNFIVRQISKTFDVSVEIAGSMLYLYNKEKIDDSVLQRMQEVFILVEREWAIYFENALLELSPSLSLPTNLYLMAESDVSKLYNEFLNLQKTDASASFRKNLNITNIDEQAVSKFYINESSTKIDEFIAIIALFYKKIINNK